MHVTASAPGKLVLLGEYAVLHGAPALVLAVDRRATATLTTIAGDAWEIVSPTLQLQARLRLAGEKTDWGDSAPPQLAWVATLLARYPNTSRLSPCRLQLDSDAFHLEHAGAIEKLGLGSSAALTVALLGALQAAASQTPPTLDAAIHAHRAIQHGHGSGIDIAAALQGGLSRFQLNGDTPRATPAKLPDGLHWCCVYSGRPASTSAMLATVAAWQAREPTAFRQHIGGLATISSRGTDAIAANDAAAFLSSLHDYARALAQFGEAAGVDIASAGHRAISMIADECGCVYKSCGAGGGDVGITFSVEDTRLQTFATRVAQAGFPVITLHSDLTGLSIVANV